MPQNLGKALLVVYILLVFTNELPWMKSNKKL